MQATPQLRRKPDSEKMKLGSTINLYAIPHKDFDKTSGELEHVLGISGYAFVHGQPEITIEIAKASTTEVIHALGGRLDGLEDIQNTIRFSIKINRALVKFYMDKVRTHYRKQGYPETRLGQSTEGVVFIGMLVADFREFAYLVIILANVSNFKSFQVYRTALVQFDRVGVVDRCSISWANRPALADAVGLKKIDLGALIDFTLARRNEFTGTLSCGFMKSLAHQSYLYSGGSRFTLNNLVWCIAAVEALLNTRGRSVRAQMEERLRCLFEGKTQEFVLKNFKELYDYRADLMHGALSLPFYLHSRGNTPFLDIPFEEAEFAFALSARLLQICFERNSYNLQFQLKILSSTN